MDVVEQIRGFNRFYTRRIGLLEPHLPGGDLSLPEGRVIYELATAAEGPRTAADLTRTLALDKGHMSRVLKRLTQRGLVESRPNPQHARHQLLALTPLGRQTFAKLDQGARDQAEALLAGIDPEGRQRLVAALGAVQATLGKPPVEGRIHLRFPQVGDLGWITHRQARLYAEEYGWDWTYEALVASILGPFGLQFDPAREDAWIAVRGEAVVGSVFLMRGDSPDVAKLRLLYVEPSARGLGVGRTLVDACVQRARTLGYERLTLWTNDVLVSARRLYIAAGFTLSEEHPHHAFGCELVSQTWDLDLQGI
jgi:DNA-binding MarR family transcriptional regulator